MRWGLALVGCVALVLSSDPALADATQCSKDAEDGQRARASGQLRAARERFVACAAAECPDVVQRDCAAWASEVLPLIPTIVIDAKDESGNDLADVVVAIDDKVVADRIDGKSISLDPGSHVLRFTHKGHLPVTQNIVANEGIKARAITVAFGPREGPPMPKRGLVSSAATGTGGHTVYPWLVAGAGVASIIGGGVLLATAPSLPAGCAKSTETCSELPTDSVRDNPATPNVENTQLEARQKDAGRSEDQPLVGAILMAAGGFFVVGGLLWHFLETPDAPPGSARVRPRLGPNGAGISATF